MLLKKITAILAVASMSVVYVASASAATSFKYATPSATISKTVVAAGDEITIDYSYDTLVDSNGGTVFIAYDGKAFTAKSGEQKIKIGKKNYDFPNYISQTTLDSISDETHILYSNFGTFEYTNDLSFKPQYTTTNTYQKDMVAKVDSSDDADVNCIKFVYGDSSYSVTAADEADDMYPVNTLGANLVANDGIAAGTYTFAIYSYANDKSATLQNYEIKTFTVTVEGDTPTPSTPKAAVAGKEVNGSKTFSTDAALEFAAGATPTIEISKTNSERTISETLESNVIGGGKTKIIPIVSYKVDGTDVKVGDIFTIKVTNGKDESTWTYKVTE